MTTSDIRLGMRFKEQAGWNQTPADWKRFLDLEPEGCFVAELESTAVGTATTCTFGPVAWVAMVLVDPSVRGRGIGTALLRQALAFLEERHVRSIRLDATELGRPVYEKLGFVPEYTLDRYAGVLPVSPPAAGVATAGHAHQDLLLWLDREVTGTDRGKLLRRLFTEGEAVRVVESGDRLDGFLMARPGARALQIGPWIAGSQAGPLLFADACHRYSGRTVFIDIPAGHEAAAARVRAAGLSVQRRLLRMGRGPRVREHREALWASSGPEKG